MTKNESLERKFLEYMMQQVPDEGAAFRGPPKTCTTCEYYQPDWKYRCCCHIYCPYHVRDQTFRPVPLETGFTPSKEVLDV